MNYQEKLDKYVTFRLTSDLSALTERQRQMLPLLIEAADTMNGLFWKQAYGDRNALIASIADPAARKLAEINYGPWDRLADNAPFIPGVGPKPAGAEFYPHDMSKEQFEAAVAAAADGGEALKILYTMIMIDDAGEMTAIPESVA